MSRISANDAVNDVTPQGSMKSAQSVLVIVRDDPLIIFTPVYNGVCFCLDLV